MSVVESPKLRGGTIAGYAGYIALDYGYHNILTWHNVIFDYVIYCLLSVNFHAFKKVDEALYLRVTDK